MNACISVTSESLMTTLMPSGGSFTNSSCSLTILRMVCGDKFSTFEIYKTKRTPTIINKDKDKDKDLRVTYRTHVGAFLERYGYNGTTIGGRRENVQ